MANIKTSGGRDRLKIDSNTIVWERHATGQYIGFRKTGPSRGTWWARVRDPESGRQHYRALGEFAEHPPAGRFDLARKAATEWFAQADAGISPHRMTVWDACLAYVAQTRRGDSKRPEEKARRTEADLRRCVADDPIAQIELVKLKAAHVEAWRDRLSAKPVRVGRGTRTKDTPRAKATVNRDLVGLRAALNLARKRGLVVSDSAWRDALTRIKHADRARRVYLSREDRSRLIESAPAEVRPLLHGLVLLPLRPGALAALKVSDYLAAEHSLRVGADKTGVERTIPVPAGTAAFLGSLCKGKLPTAPLFSTPDGGHWTKDRWKRPIARAVLAAGLRPGVTSYTLRHSTISDLVVSGLDLFTIAKISGTSIAMIEKFYGHLQQERAKAALATLAL